MHRNLTNNREECPCLLSCSARRASLQVFPNLEEGSLYLARLLENIACRALADRGVFTLALSGGETPKTLFRLLRSALWKERLAWEKVRVFWADERCVPPEHSRSNYGMAWEELLRYVAVGEIARMRGEDEPDEAARAYEQSLRERVPVQCEGVPVLDCVLLGMGEDGHIASLFPGHPALEEQSRLVVAVKPEGLEPRLTLTLPVLNSADHCVVLIAGEGKCRVLSRALDLPAASDLPVQRICPRRGEAHFIAARSSVAGGPETAAESGVLFAATCRK